MRRAALPLQVGQRALEPVRIDPVDHLAEHLDQAAVGVEREPPVARTRRSPSTESSFNPRLRIVSIIPGIETAAPERTDTSSGSAGSPKRFPSSLEPRHVPGYLVLEALREAAGGHVGPAGVGRDREPT